MSPKKLDQLARLMYLEYSSSFFPQNTIYSIIFTLEGNQALLWSHVQPAVAVASPLCIVLMFHACACLT